MSSFVFDASGRRRTHVDHAGDTSGAAPAPTCAAVIDEITKSRALVAAAACDEHTKKVLSMQLQQLEQVSTVVQKGEDCVVDDEKTKLQGDIRRLLARAKGIAAAAQKNTTTIQPRSWSPVVTLARPSPLDWEAHW